MSPRWHTVALMRPSPPLLIALLALVLAVGGGAFAAGTMVTSAQIKNGTIKPADLSPALRRSIAQTGPPGPAGAPGLSQVEVVTGASDYALGSGYRSAIASCPSGKRAVSGGGAVEGTAGPQMNITRPTAADDGWSATGYWASGAGAWQVTAYAVCAVVQ